MADTSALFPVYKHVADAYSGFQHKPHGTQPLTQTAAGKTRQGALGRYVLVAPWTESLCPLSLRRVIFVVSESFTPVRIVSVFCAEFQVGIVVFRDLQVFVCHSLGIQVDGDALDAVSRCVAHITYLSYVYTRFAGCRDQSVGIVHPMVVSVYRA